MANSINAFDYYNIFQQMDDIERYFKHNFKFSNIKGNNVSVGKTNIYVEDGSLFFQVFAPGFAKSDINIDVSNNTLSINGKTESRPTSESKNRRYVMREGGANTNKFFRHFSLPQGLNLESIEAFYDAGILTVQLPYKTVAENTTRSITIN